MVVDPLRRVNKVIVRVKIVRPFIGKWVEHNTDTLGASLSSVKMSLFSAYGYVHNAPSRTLVSTCLDYHRSITLNGACSLYDEPYC
jgi:hypothetical protein